MFLGKTFECFSPGRICANITEYEEFEALYKDLSLKDKDFIEGTTGCLYPCTYLEYRLIFSEKTKMTI